MLPEIWINLLQDNLQLNAQPAVQTPEMWLKFKQCYVHPGNSVNSVNHRSVNYT